MTHRLDLSPELEANLQALAAQRGADADATALQVLAEALEAVLAEEPPLERDEVRRRQREAAARNFGKYAGVGGTVDEFLREKHEETRREMERDERRVQEMQAREAAA